MSNKQGDKKVSGKKITTLYLEAELVQLAKERGINISEFVNDVLRMHLMDPERAELAKIEREIEETEKRLALLKLQRDALLKRIEEKERLRQLRERARKLREIKERIIELSQVVSNSIYQSEKEKAMKERNELMKELAQGLGVSLEQCWERLRAGYSKFDVWVEQKLSALIEKS